MSDAVEVVEQEHLIAQELQPIEVLGPLVVLDARDRRLQAGDVRFELDRGPVAEAHLDAVADRAQEPAGRGRRGEPDAAAHATSAVRLGEHAVGEELQPERAERVGQPRRRHDSERDDEQAGLGPVGELHRAPERAPRRREVGVARRRPRSNSRRLPP